jgi:hypothetical protein
MLTTLLLLLLVNLGPSGVQARRRRLFQNPLNFAQETFSPKPLFEFQSTDDPAPVVDLGYSQFQGYFNATFNLNIYRG